MPVPYLNDRENQNRLTGEMDAVYWPDYQPDARERKQFLVWCVLGAVLITITAITVDALRAVLLFTPVAPLVDLFRWLFRIRDGKHYATKLKWLIVPFTTVWLLTIVVPAAAHSLWLDGWAIACMATSLGLATVFASKVESHFLEYALLDARLGHGAREKWKTWLNDRFLTVLPERPLTPEEQSRFDEAVKALSLTVTHKDLLYVGTAILAAIVVLSPADGFWYRLGPRYLVCVAAFLALPLGVAALNLKSVAGWKRQLFCTAAAFQLWCNSPPAVRPGARVPWSPRSPFGNAENRRALLFMFAAAIAFLLIPFVVFFPVLETFSGVSWQFSYQITGSQLFARFNTLRLSPDQALLLKVAMPLLAGGVMPLFFFGVLFCLVGPTVGATDELFRGSQALERRPTRPLLP